MAGESAREEARRAREKAERLARRAELFEKGADGEAATAAILRGLPPEWGAIHDRRWPLRRLANIDHVVIGPGGIFVIDSKNWSGRITVDGGRLRQNGRSREKEVARCADAGLAVAELAGPFSNRVHPVVCFTREEPLTGRSREVLVCSSSTLVQLLLSRPRVLSEDEAREAWLRLDMQLRAASSAPTTSRPRPERASVRPAITRAVSTRPSRASRTRQKALRQFVMSLFVLAAFVAFGPQMAGAVGGLVAEHVTKTITSCDESASTARTEASNKSAQSSRDSTVRPRVQEQAPSRDKDGC